MGGQADPARSTTGGLPRRVPAARAHGDGVLLPAFVDAHVHLGLVEASALRTGGIAAVDDLGWDPEAAAGWAGRPGGPAGAGALPDTRVAGAFLTAPGGYPSDRSWAPAAAVRALGSPDDAADAVAQQLAAGAAYVKVVLHTGGPVLDDATLAAVVAAARRARLPVVAHAEGPGQAQRALAAGVDRLAHTPWTERLGDDVVEAAASRQVWVSTLDIHGWGAPSPAQERDRGVALDNLRRFHAAGGVVAYGTDLGNGPLPVGLNLRELRALAEAGLQTPALLRALTSRPVAGLATYLPGTAPDGATGPDELVERLADAAVVVDPTTSAPADTAPVAHQEDTP